MQLIQDYFHHMRLLCEKNRRDGMVSFIDGAAFSKNDMYINVFSTVHENLREDSNARYEYILPNIMYGKTFFSDKFGIIDFKSNALHRNYDVKTNENGYNLNLKYYYKPFLSLFARSTYFKH